MTAHVDRTRLVIDRSRSEVLGGPIDYAVYLPSDYETSTTRYPALYLLHGRGDSREAWHEVLGDLDELTEAGVVPPMIAVMPDAPWSERAGYYVDSLFVGDSGHEAGVAIETAYTKDLVGHIDGRFRTRASRESRVLCGYSMGGAGTVRLVTTHPEVFGSGIAMSPAVYAPLPPMDSTARGSGAFGVGNELFVDDRYRELGYQAGLATFDSRNAVHLFIGVGDDEAPHASFSQAASSHAHPVVRERDERLEAEVLSDRARLVPGLTTEFRLVAGPHDWSVWRPLFRLGLVDVARRSPIGGLSERG